MPQAAIFSAERTFADFDQYGRIDCFDVNGNHQPNSVREAALIKLKQRVQAKLLSNSRLKVIASLSSCRYYRGEMILTQNMSSYAPLRTEHVVKDLPSNAPFNKRRKAGEVVLSSCEHGRVEVTSYPGVSKGSLFGTDGGAEMLTRDFLIDLGYAYVPLRNWGNYLYDYDTPGVYMANASLGNIHYDLFNGVDALPPIELTAETVYANVLNTFVVDTTEVTATVADANKRLLDLMTTLAEAPEALKSIAQFSGMVASIIKGSKQRSFHLSQSFKNREQREKEAFDRELTSIKTFFEDLTSRDAQKVPARVMAKRRRLRQRREQRAVRTYEMAKQSTKRELGDAIANVWMEFRYSIMPMVYTAIDITEAITKDPEFLTTRNDSKFEFPASFDIAESFRPCTFDNIFNVFIKDKAGAAIGPFSLTSKVMSANIVVTAFELIPYSYIADWFVNLGDFISAITGGNSTNRSSSLSFKSEFNYDEIGLDERRVTIDCRIYRRTVMGNLSQYTCLTFEPDMNTKRAIDSIALLWNSQRRNLIKST